MALLQEAAPLAEPSHSFWTGKGQLCFPAVNSSAPWDQLPNITISLQTNSSAAFDITITAQVRVTTTIGLRPSLHITQR